MLYTMRNIERLAERSFKKSNGEQMKHVDVIKRIHGYLSNSELTVPILL